MEDILDRLPVNSGCGRYRSSTRVFNSFVPVSGEGSRRRGSLPCEERPMEMVNQPMHALAFSS